MCARGGVVCVEPMGGGASVSVHACVPACVPVFWERRKEEKAVALLR